MEIVFDFFLGRNKSRSRERTKTPATELLANTSFMIAGKASKKDGFISVIPTPTQKEIATIIIFLSVSPQSATIFKPVKTMEPYIIMVHPPSTASGMELKKAPIGGKREAIIRMKAPIRIVKRFTTLVIAINPIF